MNSVVAPVAILAAGKGTRMGAVSAKINKALLPYQGQALISHIMARFPPETEFVIALGYQAQQVRDYLRLAHPGLCVRFVDVPNFDGAGSGPGCSLLYCRPWLQRPFYFVPCDTLFADGPEAPPHGNWVGVGRVSPEESRAYCNFLVKDGRVTAIRDKQTVTEPTARAFSGLLYVHDHDIFWAGLADTTLCQGEHQVSNGLQRLLDGPGLASREVAWQDLGDEARYRAALEQTTRYDFSKTDECLYFVDGRAIKFFADPAVVAGRVVKAALKPDIFPAIEGAGDQFYSYRLLPGRTLYEYNHRPLFQRLLQWLDQNVWTSVPVPAPRVRSLCLSFYKDKTLKRVADFHKKYPSYQPPTWFNGQPLASVNSLLARLDWEQLADGVPAFIHGDLQFDNILYDETRNRYFLLDWRQDFAGEVSFGDLYYDLAKLLGGTFLNYDLIKAGYLRVERQQDHLLVDFPRRFVCAAYEKDLGDYVRGRGLSMDRVRTLTALIFLNMAPLHHPPFDQMLYALSAHLLERELTRRVGAPEHLGALVA